MKKVQGLAISRILLAVCIIVIASGIAQAQSDLPVFTGKFTLSTQVRWNTAVLQPGDYSVIVENFGRPAYAIVRNSEGRSVARVMCQILDGKASARNELYIRERDGSSVYTS